MTDYADICTRLREEDQDDLPRKEAAAAIEALVSENERLARELSCRDALIKDHLGKIMHLENRIEEEHYRGETLTARLRSMCEAMEPFAKAEEGSLVASQCPDHATLAIGPAAERILYRDLRHARAELDAAKKEIGPIAASE